MTPEQIKKHEPMNINNFLEKVLVENGLPIKEGWYHTANGYFFYAPSKKMWVIDANYIRPETIKHWYRPVTRESIEAFLRELINKAFMLGELSGYQNSQWDDKLNGVVFDSKTAAKDKQTAITELIKQFTHPAPLGDKQ